MSGIRNQRERVYSFPVYIPLEDAAWIDDQVAQRANGCASRGAVISRLVKAAKAGVQ